MTASPAMLRRARPVVSATREIEPESAPPQPKEGPLSRAVRLIIAIPLFALSVAALFPFAVLPVSTQAVVNARLARVRSPRGGQVQGVSLETGDVVSTHQRLALITGSRSISRDEVSDTLHTVGALEEESSHVRAELVSAQLQKSRYDQMYRAIRIISANNYKPRSRMLSGSRPLRQGKRRISRRRPSATGKLSRST